MFDITYKQLCTALDTLVKLDFETVSVYHDPDGEPVTFSGYADRVEVHIVVPPLTFSYTHPFQITREQLSSMRGFLDSWDDLNKYKTVDNSSLVVVSTERQGSTCHVELRLWNGLLGSGTSAKALEFYKVKDWFYSTPLAYVDSLFICEMADCSLRKELPPDSAFFEIGIQQLTGFYPYGNELHAVYTAEADTPETPQRFPIPDLALDYMAALFGKDQLAFYYESGKVAFSSDDEACGIKYVVAWSI